MSQDPPAPARTLDEARQDIRSGAVLSKPFFVMNGLATLVASYGLLSNSTAVVIGAMLIAMLLGPITGMALALVDGDSALFTDSLAAEVLGALLVLAIAFGIGWIHQDIPAGSELLNRTKPNILDIAIALAGGAAGAYAVVSPKVRAGLVGTAIATALVPPLCTAGIFLARGEPQLAAGGILLWFANLVAIQAASSLTLFVLGFRGILVRKDDLRPHLARIFLSAVALVGLAIALGASLANTVASEKLRREVDSRIREGLKEKKGAFLAELDLEKTDEGITAFAVVRTPFSFTPEEVGAIQDVLPPEVKLQVRAVITKDTTAEGYVYLMEDPTDEAPSEEARPAEGNEGPAPNPGQP